MSVPVRVRSVPRVIQTFTLSADAPAACFHRLHCLFDHRMTTMEDRLVRPEQLDTNIIMVICILI